VDLLMLLGPIYVFLRKGARIQTLGVVLGRTVHFPTAFSPRGDLHLGILRYVHVSIACNIRKSPPGKICLKDTNSTRKYCIYVLLAKYAYFVH
jgi:hypothetical protein